MKTRNKTKDVLPLEKTAVKETLDSLSVLHKQENQELKRLESLLGTREKELNCYKRISEITNNPLFTIHEVLKEIVAMIPDVLQFPALTAVSVCVDDLICHSDNFAHTNWSITKDLIFFGENGGYIEVNYLRSELFNPEKPFLNEEEDMLHAIARQLSNLIERSRATETFVESEKNYRYLIENINDVIFEIDTKGIITYISPSIQNLVGFSQDELIGKSFLQFTGENAEYLAQRFVELSLSSEIEREYKIVAKDGKPHWIRFSTKARMKDGVFMGGIGTLVDISDRKEMEHALQKNEELFRNLVETIDEVIYEMAGDGTISYISPVVENILGFRNVELIGKNIFDFVYEADKPTLKNKLLTNTKENLSQHQEYRFITKSGEIKWLRKSIKVIDQDGDQVHTIGTLIDINEQKKFEIELQKSEDLYRSILIASPDVITITDLEGRIQFSSPNMELMFGMEHHDDVINHHLIEYIAESDQSRAISNLAKMFRGEYFGSAQYKGLRRDGSTFDIEVNGQFIRRADGQSKGMVFITRDISRRMFIEAKLRRSEENFRHLVETVNDAIYEITSEGIINYVSPSIEKILGYTPEELIRTNLFNYLVPEDKPMIYEALSTLGQVDYLNVEFRVFSNDGQSRWVSSSTTPILKEGKVIGVTGSMTNINDRKLAENELRKLSRAVEQSPVSIVITNLKGNIEYANPKVFEATGYSEDELIGQNTRILKSGETGNEEYAHLWDSISAGNHWHGIFHNKKKDGTLYWESAVISPILDSAGKITHYLAVKEDITERILALEELKQSEERYKSIFQKNHSVMIIVDPETGEIKDANSSACNYYKYTYEELRRKNISEINLLSKSEIHREMQSAKAEKRSNFIFKHLLGNGEIRDVEVYSCPIKFGGTPLLYSIIHDITDRKIAENALIKREAELNEAQKIAQMCSWELETESGILNWSENYYKIMGVPEGTEMKTKYFLDRVHPKDLPIVDIKYLEMIKTHKSVEYDIRVLMPDQHYSWVQNNIVPEFKDDKLVRLRGVNIDVSEKKADEEKIRKQNEWLNAIIMAIPDLIFVLTKEGNYKEFFAADPTKLLIPMEKIIGSNIREVFNNELAILFQDKISKVLFFKEPTTVTYAVSLPESASSHFEARIVPLDDDRVLVLSRDVTEKVKNEIEIKKLSLAVEQSPVSIIITDLKSHIEYANRAFFETTGYTSEEVIGQSIDILKPAETPDDLYTQMQDRITKGLEWHGEWLSKKKSGELFWETVSITPVHDENGIITSYIAVKQDITKRKETENDILNLNANLEVLIQKRTAQLGQTNENLRKEIEDRNRAEIALLESESKYKTVVENIREVIFYTDAEGLWVYLNTSWTEITGFTLEESIGQLFINYVHPDDRVRNWELFEPLINRKKEYCRHEIRYLTKSGGFRWIEVFARLALNEKGEITGTYGTLQDITDRRQAETALRDSEIKHTSMIANISDVIGVIEVNGVMSYKSPNITRYFGWQPEDLIGSSSWSTVHPDDLERIQNEFYELVQVDNSARTVEYRYLCKDGSYKPIELTATNLINDKVINGILLNYHDITARKLVEESLEQMSSRLNLALRAGGIGVWDYDVDHNLLVWDDHMFAIYGIRKENFSNAYDAWLKGLHPDDKIRGDEEIQMAIRGEKEFDTEFRVVWPDGSIHFVRALAAVERDTSGHALRVIGTNWDITIQKQAESFENELLHMSPKLTGIPLPEIDHALNQSLDRIGRFLNADRAYIFEFNHDNKTFSNTFEWCNEGINPEIENLQDISIEALPKWMETLERRENILIQSVKDLPESWKAEREILEPQGIQSLIVIPMYSENSLIGFVGLDSVFLQKEYSDAEVNILRVWSAMLASLINNKRAEFLLEQTRQNYETFFNTIDDFLWVLDETGNIIHVNSTVSNRLEYSAEELMGKSVLLVHPAARRDEAGRIVGEMLAGTADFCPVPIVSKSGRQISVETRVKRGFWNNQSVIFGVSKDISQIELSEQKFSKAFQANSVMMSLAEFETGYFFDINSEFSESLGYSREEVIGKTVQELDLFVDEDLRHRIKNSLRNNIPVRKEEIKVRTKNGTIKNILISSDAIFIGSIRYFLCTMIDISERKKAEEEAVSARYEAEMANVAKSEFLSRMSHELRTPMNSILGFAQLLELGDLNPGQKKGVNYIMRSGKHLLDLINEVLDISRIEAGHLYLSLEPVLIKEVINEMFDLVGHQAKAREIQLEFIDIPNQLIYIKADKQRLKQILLNLLNNAIKYNKNGGRVFLESRVIPQGGHGTVMVRISVIDTGIGILEANISKLFNPFERIGAEKSDTEGTGLGLAVVKKLTMAMGGNIGVESVPGEGSTFWIEFPICEAIKKGRDQILTYGELIAKDADKSGLILYIEDNASNVALVREILSSQRPKIQLVTDPLGLNTIPLALEYRPNMIFLDLNLPDIHGSEVLEMLQTNEETKDIPVVVISADAMQVQIEKLTEIGAKRYITKPLEINIFLKTIDEFII